MVSSTPRPHFTPGKDATPILQEAEWAPGPVWTGGKSRPHRYSIPDRPARSQSLYRLSYPAYSSSSGSNDDNNNNNIVTKLYTQHEWLDTAIDVEGRDAVCVVPDPTKSSYFCI